MEERILTAGDLVQHFKRETLTPQEKSEGKYLYRIIGTAHHTETGELLMIYQAQYGEHGLCARPYEMFMGKVDRDKYPQIKQEYRFEKVEEQP